jgi:hypothetical protein
MIGLRFSGSPNRRTRFTLQQLHVDQKQNLKQIIAPTAAHVRLDQRHLDLMARAECNRSSQGTGA